MRLSLVLAVALGLLGLPHLAHAHALMGGSGLFAGLPHPVGGWDHLLAKVCVGVVSAQKGRTSIWVISAVFVTVMVAGGQVGMRGSELPLVELGVALSVILLGVAVLVNRHLPIAAMVSSVAVFGLYHGYAHSLENPDPSLTGFSTLGFVITTIGLHVMGVTIGLIARESPHGPRFLRLAGSFAAAAGIAFAIRVLGAGYGVAGLEVIRHLTV